MKEIENHCKKIKVNYIQVILSFLIFDEAAFLISFIWLICCLFDSQQFQGYMTIVIIWSIALGFNLISIIYSIFCPCYLKTYHDDIEIKFFRKKYYIKRNQIISIEHYTCNFIQAILYWLYWLDWSFECGPLTLSTYVKYRDENGNVRKVFFISSTKTIKNIFPNAKIN